MCVCVCVCVCVHVFHSNARYLEKCHLFIFKSNMYRHHVLDAVYIIFDRNYILTSEKQI